MARVAKKATTSRKKAVAPIKKVAPSSKKAASSSKKMSNYELHTAMVDHHTHVLNLHDKLDKLQLKLLQRSKNPIQHFDWDDFAQQVVGALIVSLPFSMTAEVWSLARALSWFQIGFLVLLMFLFDTIITHYTDIRKVCSRKIFGIPLRVISLVVVSYGINVIVLSLMGIFGSEVTDLMWALKLVIVLGFFSSVGASTVDLVK